MKGRKYQAAQHRKMTLVRGLTKKRNITGRGCTGKGDVQDKEKSKTCESFSEAFFATCRVYVTVVKFFRLGFGQGSAYASNFRILLSAKSDVGRLSATLQ